jgi:predicted nucleic acid-binding protein
VILLDTNVVSELMRAAPERSVEEWVATRQDEDLFITAITEAELRYGAALLPTGKRRTLLVEAIEAMLREDFRGRVVPFDSAAAIAFAQVAAERRQAGKPIAHADAQIAAIARSRNALLATRNVSDFVGCGVQVVNPWTS